MNARKKQHNNKDNNKNNNKEIARSKLELRGNRKMLISASHVPTSFANHNNGNNYVSTMNTVGKSVERNSITQKFHQHLKKNMKISNFNQLTGLTKQNHSRDYPDITRSKAMKKGFDARQSQGLERKRKISQVSIKKNKKLNAKKILQTQPHVDADSQSMEMLSPIQKLNDDCLRLVFDLLTLEERLKIEPVCKKWRSVNRSISWKVKGLYYPYVEPLSWRQEISLRDYYDNYVYDPNAYHDPRYDDIFQSYKPLHVLKQRFTYVPRLLALCGKHLQELDLSAFTDSTILTKLKIHAFPNLIKLKLRIFSEWEPEHCNNLFKKMNKLESFHVTTDRNRTIPLELFKAISILTETLKELSIINFTYHQYSGEREYFQCLEDNNWDSEQLYLRDLIGLKSLRFLEFKGFIIRGCDLEMLKLLNLETFIMARCVVTDTPSDLLHILDYKNLKKLAIDGTCFEDLTYIFKKIPKKLNNLRKIVLYEPPETEHEIKTMSSHFSDKCEIIIAEDPAKLRGIINPWRGISL